MLGGILGRGCWARCKSLLKQIKSRIEVIRRKRKATLKFLRKDIADLLNNGLEVNAYGRADGLLAELTLSQCYDFLERACDFVLVHLPVMQKISHCPEDCREAVSSLMFAAARFSDLPELRDLRQLFYERYESSVDLYANKQLMENLSSKPFIMERKIQLMENISAEYSCNWDSDSFQKKMLSSASSAKEQIRASESLRANDVKSDVSKSEQDSHSSKQLAASSPAKEQMKPCSLKQQPVSLSSASEGKSENDNLEKKIIPQVEIPKQKVRSLENAPPYVRSVSNDATCRPSQNGEEVSLGDEAGTLLYGRSLSSVDGKKQYKVMVPPPYTKPNIKPQERSVDSKKNFIPSDKDNSDDLPRNEDKASKKRSSRATRRDGDSRKGLQVLIEEHCRRREERMIDKLLMHYSTQPSTAETVNLRSLLGEVHERGGDGDEEKGKKAALLRSSSLPKETIPPPESAKPFARAATFQDASGAARHVHPKLPDYDDLAARFAALKGR